MPNSSFNRQRRAAMPKGDHICDGEKSAKSPTRGYGEEEDDSKDLGPCQDTGTSLKTDGVGTYVSVSVCDPRLF